MPKSHHHKIHVHTEAPQILCQSYFPYSMHRLNELGSPVVVFLTHSRVKAFVSPFSSTKSQISNCLLKISTQPNMLKAKSVVFFFTFVPFI